MRAACETFEEPDGEEPAKRPKGEAARQPDSLDCTVGTIKARTAAEIIRVRAFNAPVAFVMSWASEKAVIQKVTKGGIESPF